MTLLELLLSKTMLDKEEDYNKYAKYDDPFFDEEDKND